MTPDKFNGVAMIVTGLVVVGAGVFIYFIAHTMYPDSLSTRVQNLNWLLKTFGKTTTASIFGIIGLLMIISGIRKFRQ
ncbi:MAG TPA: hypothetical protein PKJ94_11725 [Ferruginibacter sp.]|nr:hypothetical protein [Ferruginibacter sp.]